jgi:hypothetical protein
MISATGSAQRNNGLPRTISSDRLLLVEGKDECVFFAKWLPLILTPTVEIVNIGGRNQFNNLFPTITKLPGFRDVKRIGIIRDAEDNSASTYQSIANTALCNQIKPPTSAGTIQDSILPYLGIWIMPDNQNPGSIENLCWDIIPRTDPRRLCTESFIQCVQNVLTTDALPNRLEKAKVQAYLGTLHKPLRELGRAAEADVWDFKHQRLNNLRDFLIQLFK